jgi:hypothetical protein
MPELLVLGLNTLTAIDGNYVPGNMARFFRVQERHHRGNFFGFSESVSHSSFGVPGYLKKGFPLRTSDMEKILFSR